MNSTTFLVFLNAMQILWKALAMSESWTLQVKTVCSCTI